MRIRTRVLVMGVRDEVTALAAAEAGADAVGFVFQPNSPWFVEPEEAWDIAAALPPFVTTVGVFTNASVDRFLAIEEVCPTDWNLLRGDEDEETVRQCGPRVIKTVRLERATLERDLAAWGEVEEAEAVLLEPPAGKAAGDVGWDEVARLVAGFLKPLMVGGMGAGGVGEVVRKVHPWGVELAVPSTGNAAGAVEAFCKAARAGAQE